MTEHDRLAAALRRLVASIDLVEAALSRRAEADGVRADLAEELGVMDDDRSRLALELDGALARSRALAEANAAVARRLEGVDATLRAMLAGDAGGDD